MINTPSKTMGYWCVYYPPTNIQGDLHDTDAL